MTSMVAKMVNAAGEAGGGGDGDGGGGDGGGIGESAVAMIIGSHCGEHATPGTLTLWPWVIDLRDENQPGFMRMGVNEEPREPYMESGPETSQSDTGE